MITHQFPSFSNPLNPKGIEMWIERYNDGTHCLFRRKATYSSEPEVVSISEQDALLLIIEGVEYANNWFNLKKEGLR